MRKFRIIASATAAAAAEGAERGHINCQRQQRRRLAHAAREETKEGCAKRRGVGGDGVEAVGVAIKRCTLHAYVKGGDPSTVTVCRRRVVMRLIFCQLKLH